APPRACRDPPRPPARAPEDRRFRTDRPPTPDVPRRAGAAAPGAVPAREAAERKPPRGPALRRAARRNRPPPPLLLRAAKAWRSAIRPWPCAAAAPDSGLPPAGRRASPQRPPPARPPSRATGIAPPARGPAPPPRPPPRQPARRSAAAPR